MAFKHEQISIRILGFTSLLRFYENKSKYILSISMAVSRRRDSAPPLLTALVSHTIPVSSIHSVYNGTTHVQRNGSLRYQ